LVFQIPHIKGTDDYTLLSVPYTPYPYTTPTGVEDNNLYNDDEYSFLVNLPFTFCFYGANYTSTVVGSNGIMTFDPANASCENSWPITQPIFFAGGSICNASSTYYPRASIMGAYSDLDPRFVASPANRKIQWDVSGIAPCRKFIVSYNRVGVFGSTCGLTTPNTFQMVIHESTGIVEIFIERKDCSSSTNAGRAIMGIQNWARDQAVAAVGKNNSVWNETNTGYRFVPSGGGSRYVRSELLNMSGTVLATADTSTTVAGLLDVAFTNFCPPAGNNNYVVRTTFSACDNAATQLVTLDNITINRTNSLNATATATNSACGPPSGTITVTVPPGIGTPPYTYVLDGGAPVTGPSPYTFTNVSATTHTIDVVDASAGCVSNIIITVNLTNGITANTTSTATACTGVSDGTITVTPTSGTPPYMYSLNGGAPVSGGVPYTFTGLAATTHTIVVRDAATCISNTIIVNVATGSGVSANATQSGTSCPTANNGSITVTATAGTAPFTFQLNAGAPQAGTSPYTFSNLLPGLYNVTVRDANGCIRPINNINVNAGPVLSANLATSATSCNGAANGSITVTPTSGTAPYTFSLDGAPAVVGAVPYTFTNVSATTHNIVVYDAAGCISNQLPVSVAAGPALTTTASKTDVLCNAGATGTITVTQPTIGNPPYEYSLDNVNWQTSNVFTGLTAFTYTVYYREVNGCVGSQQITVAEPPVLSATAAAVPVVCNGQSNGIITVSTTGGVAPYQYSIDGGTTWQNSNVFNVPANLYTILIRDANGCTTPQTINVTQPAVLSASPAVTNASCDGGNDGTITVTAAGGNASYEYSLDNANWQSGNVFNVAPNPYTVYVRDNLGCTTSFTTTVGLNNNLTFTPQADPTICESKSTQLELVSNATQYAWSPGTGLSSTTIYNPTANPIVTTDYTVIATLGRCTATDIVRVNVNAAPIPDAGADGYICYGQTYPMLASGGTQYVWSPSTYLDNPNSSNPISNPAKDITYTLSILSDVNGCASLVTDQIYIDVTPPVKVTTFPYDTIAYPGDKFRLLAVPSDTDANIYTWTPTTGLSNPTIGLSNLDIANPIVTIGPIGSDITYQVITSTIAGCKGEGYVHIKVYTGPDIYVPTGFTPNGDGRNDVFIPFPVGIKSLNYFRVYNRWGQLVFSANALHKGWDGRINGREQSTGTYVWMAEGITNQGKVITKRGTVTLIR
jgi:gliding motility-associated-like protein